MDREYVESVPQGCEFHAHVDVSPLLELPQLQHTVKSNLTVALCIVFAAFVYSLLHLPRLLAVLNIISFIVLCSARVYEVFEASDTRLHMSLLLL